MYPISFKVVRTATRDWAIGLSRVARGMHIASLGMDKGLPDQPEYGQEAHGNRLGVANWLPWHGMTFSMAGKGMS